MRAARRWKRPSPGLKASAKALCEADSRPAGRRSLSLLSEIQIAQAADDGLSFGAGLILGRAVGGLWPRFRLKRVSMPQTALRLHARRRAICAALCPGD